MLIVCFVCFDAGYYLFMYVWFDISLIFGFVVITCLMLLFIVDLFKCALGLCCAFIGLCLVGCWLVVVVL